MLLKCGRRELSQGAGWLLPRFPPLSPPRSPLLPSWAVPRQLYIRENIPARALHSVCDPVRSCVLKSIRWRVHQSCVHASSDLSGYGPIPPQVLTRFVYSALNDAAFVRSRRQVQRRQARVWQRERELCSSLGSHLPVFEFAGARLCGVHEGEERDST